MKQRISILLLAFVAVNMLFSGCTKDYSQLILGSWNLDGERSYSTVRFEGEEIVTYLDESNITLTFNADGTLRKTEILEGGYEVNYDGNYYLKGRRLTMESKADGTETYTIDKIDANILILTASEKDYLLGSRRDYEYYAVLTR